MEDVHVESLIIHHQFDVLDGLGPCGQDREGGHGRLREGAHSGAQGRQLAQRPLSGPRDGQTLLGGRQAPPHLQQ